jgi:uncharacterized membrane protein YkvA (DUF1232 family)
MKPLYQKENNMADKKKRDLMVAPQSGVIHNLVMQAKLLFRLLGDRRVSFLAKLIPIGALIYLVSPVDLMPGVTFPVIGALDDAAIIGLSSYVFLELCPPAVVKEHMKALTSNMDEPASDEVVDADATEIKEETK